MPKRKLDRFLVHLMSHGRELHNLGAANIKALWPEVSNDLLEGINFEEENCQEHCDSYITRRGFE